MKYLEACSILTVGRGRLAFLPGPILADGTVAAHRCKWAKGDCRVTVRLGGGGRDEGVTRSSRPRMSSAATAAATGPFPAAAAAVRNNYAISAGRRRAFDRRSRSFTIYRADRESTEVLVKQTRKLRLRPEEARPQARLFKQSKVNK